jgi:hypothetical protein
MDNTQYTEGENGMFSGRIMNTSENVKKYHMGGGIVGIPIPDLH